MAQPVQTSTGAPAPGGHGGGFPPFDSHSFGSQLVFFAIAFGLLYVLMSRVALPRVAGILEARHKTVENDIEAAAKMKAAPFRRGASIRGIGMRACQLDLLLVARAGALRS